jgi:hypothetical protein
MGTIAKLLAVIIAVYLLYGAVLYITGGSQDITLILTGPIASITDAIGGFL